MGLAASQVRFLNLTARKNNIEYEAQQINQQRTTLANQSATYYNEMLTMSVPVPPSTSAYQTIVYTMDANNAAALGVVSDDYETTNFTINQITGSNSDATVVYTRTYVDPYSLVKKDESYVTYTSGTGYSVNGTKLVSLDDENLYKELEGAVPAIVTNMQKIQKDATASNTYVRKSGSESNPVYTYYYLESEQSGPATEYKQASLTKYSQGAVKNAEIRRDGNNKVTGIVPQGQSDALAVNTATVQDTVAYEEAYNQYTYETYLYEQQMEAINAQTSVIQAQDKKLELRLKQLDTEQNAISTEMDSISNVIKKNVEKSFNTFA